MSDLTKNTRLRTRRAREDSDGEGGIDKRRKTGERDSGEPRTWSVRGMQRKVVRMLQSGAQRVRRIGGDSREGREAAGSDQRGGQEAEGRDRRGVREGASRDRRGGQEAAGRDRRRGQEAADRDRRAEPGGPNVVQGSGPSRSKG